MASSLGSSSSTSPFGESAADMSAMGEGPREIIGIFVQLGQAFGLPRSLSEIYGLLFATARPLSSQELIEQLNLSKGTVSQGIRFLRTLGAVKPVVVVGDRREFFEPVLELRQLVAGFLRERINPQLDDWKIRSQGLSLKHFPEVEHSADEAVSETLSARIDKLKTWQKRASTVLPAITRLLG